MAGPHGVVCVVSQPDRPRGRGRRLCPSPVSEVALHEGIALLRPERVGTPEVQGALRRLAPDLGVVVAFGQFLPKRIRELPALGYLINGHASLLPKGRGAAPIPRAILAGETATGVSVMRIERAMDAGPVALQRELAIEPEETAGELTERVARLTAAAVAEVVDQIAARRVSWTPQDPSRATHAPKVERAEGLLDWGEPAQALARRVRALAPTPGAFTFLGGETLRILAARAVPEACAETPGTARRSEDGALRIATGAGWLELLRVQRAGGKVLDVDTFLRGRPIAEGTRLGRDATATLGT